MNTVDFNQSRGDKSPSCVLGKSSSTSCSPNQRFGQLSKVAIYVRLSDEDRDKRNATDESESIQNQKSMLVAYAMEKGWDVYKIYCDEDYSGADKSRPEWNKLIADAEEQKFNIVLCKTQSRFSRELEMVEKYIHDKFLEWNIRFVSIVDNADTDIKGNKKSRQINGLINEWYLEDLSDNIRRTLNHKKQNGEWTGSFAPYGFMRDPLDKNHLVIDEEAAEVVREIFDMFLNGMGYLTIAQNLNNRGILNPANYKKSKGSKYSNRDSNRQRVTGNMWTNDTIYYILRKEEYIGTLCQNKTENISYKNKKRRIHSRDKWTRTFNAHEPIIGMDIWERVQAKLSTRTRPDKRTGEKHIFNGKVFCGVCENTLTKVNTPENKGGFRYLKCRTYNNSTDVCDNGKSIRFDALEDIVLIEVNKLLTEYHDSAKIKVDDAGKQRKLDKLAKEKSDIAAQLEKKNKVIELLYSDRVDGIITSEQFIQFSKTAQDSIDTFNERVSRIDMEIEAIKQGLADDNIKEKIIVKYSRIDKLTHEIVGGFIKTIYVGKVGDKNVPREIKIVWNF
ncbi:MAG: recombinase family protein [Oscillospiraceae bacterium]|nr:recombinase family protein [Oscillospiraceae bacterium]